MTDLTQNAIRYIRAVLDEMGVAPTALAGKAGIASTTLTRALNDPDHKFSISNKTLKKIEDASGFSYAEFLASDQLQARAASGSAPVIIPGPDLVAQNGEMLPVYAAARGGDGHIIVSFDEIERVKMPSVLQGVRGGYGLLIEGESMVPAYFPGDTALVHPHLRPSRGFNHVFYHKPPHGGEEEAIVKQLDAFNDREWTLTQWNPKETWKESRQVWQTCHRIVGKYDRR
jgi:hypothetical protein